MEYLGRTKNNHTIYGDKDVSQFKFIDSSIHNHHIGSEYYAEAKRTAQKIENVKRHGVMETFICKPSTYDDAYMFWGVHITYENEYHDVIVPDIGCIGTGESLNAAIEDIDGKILYKIAISIKYGEPIVPPSKEMCYEFGNKRVVEIHEEEPVKHWDVVSIHVKRDRSVCDPEDMEDDDSLSVEANLWQTVSSQKQTSSNLS